MVEKENLETMVKKIDNSITKDTIVIFTFGDSCKGLIHNLNNFPEEWGLYTRNDNKITDKWILTNKPVDLPKYSSQSQQ